MWNTSARATATRRGIPDLANVAARDRPTDTLGGVPALRTPSGGADRKTASETRQSKMRHETAATTGHVGCRYRTSWLTAYREDQIATLKALGCDRFFYEEASTRTERPEFARMTAEADRIATPERRICLVASKMDRAFRDLSAADAAISRPGNTDVIWLLPDLSPNPLDPKDAVQMLLVRCMAAIGQFERDRLAERRAYGIARAKAEGKYRGRKPTARAKTPEVLKLRDRGFRPDEIAKQLEIGRASVFRILRDCRDQDGPMPSVP